MAKKKVPTKINFPMEDFEQCSSLNDVQMQLLATFLSETKTTIEVRELKALGRLISSYIEKKIVIDHVFWNRSTKTSKLNDEELECMILELKNNLVK